MADLTPETALAMAACNGAKTLKFYARFPYIGTETELSQAKEMIAALALLGFEVRRKASADAVRNVLGRCLPDADKEPHLVAERREVLAKGGAT